MKIETLELTDDGVVPNNTLPLVASIRIAVGASPSNPISSL